MKVLLALLVATLGVAFTVYAGLDDAPGGVLMGILLVIGSATLGGRR